MNRDEKRTRAPGLPPAKRNREGRRMVYPSESGGGTWIALNDSGVALALINWYSVTARVRPNPVSRGEVIPRLSLANDPARLAAGVAALPLDRLNPFRLIGVFPGSRQIMEWRWDMKRLARKSHGWRSGQWISSGFDEAKAQKVRSGTFRRAQAQKSAGTIHWLRRLHRSHSPVRGPFSTCMHRDDAVTVSYTEIAVDRSRGQMRHVRGPPCGGLRRALRRAVALRLVRDKSSPQQTLEEWLGCG